jgi:hypothetical protein
MKWVALALIVAGGLLAVHSKTPGEGGYPLRVIAGFLSVFLGVAWLLVLWFAAL